MEALPYHKVSLPRITVFIKITDTVFLRVLFSEPAFNLSYSDSGLSPLLSFFHLP